MPTEFYSGMKGPVAIAKLNELWGYSTGAAGSEVSAIAAAAAAAASQIAAAASASAALASQTAAANSQTSAASSATVAASGAATATAKYDLFDDRFLGAKATHPSVDNSGDALSTGTLYFNTTDSTMYVRSGSSTWVAVASLSSSTAAAASATAAAASQASAASSQTAATTSAAAALSSQTASATSASAASTSQALAASSQTAAAASATSAQASQDAAALSYDLFDDRFLGAKASAPNVDNDGGVISIGALYFDTNDNNMYVRTTLGSWVTVSNTASSASAAASASSASTSQAAAAASASAANTSQIAAAASQTAAATSASAAATSETAAATSATSALTSKNAAAASETAAASSATAAATSATSATSSQTAAATSATTATTSATTATTKAAEAVVSANNADDSALLAEAWATQLVTPVSGGEYSAKYWAQQVAATVSGQLIYRGAWDASTGNYPTRVPAITLGDYYKVTVAGTVSAIDYAVGDNVIYNGSGWDKIDNTETVVNTSINLTGEIVGSGITGTPISTTLGTVADVDFNTNTPGNAAVARLAWNDSDGTLEVGLKGGTVSLQIGQEQVQRVYNNTGIGLTNGQVVYATGAQGQRLTVASGSNTAESTSSKTLGVLTENIAAGTEGFVTTEGLVRNLNTAAFAEGSALWLGTSGTLTSTRPAAPAHAVLVGFCIRQHASSGSIFVKVQNGYELEELHDVSISSPADTHMLVYENSLWKNKAPSQVRDTLDVYSKVEVSTYVTDAAIAMAIALG